MSFSIFSPHWFFGYDIVLEILFAIICLMISLYAFKIYKKTDELKLKLFGLAFLFISLSYIIQSIFSFLIISKTDITLCSIINIKSIHLFNLLGMYTHIILMTAGLVTLAYTTFQINKRRLLVLLLVISILGIFMSKNSIDIFFLFTTIYLIILAYHFIKNHFEKKNEHSLIIASAFICLFLAYINYIISLAYPFFYVFGHLLELIAYVLILWNLYKVAYK